MPQSLERFLLKALRLGVYAAPLVFLIIIPGIAYPFLFTKTAAWLLLMGLLGLIWGCLLLFSSSPDYRVRLTPLSKAIVIWVAVLFVAAFVGVNLSRSLWSSPMRSFGIMAMFSSVLYFFILKIPALHLRSRSLLFAFVHVGTLAAVWALIQGTTVRPGSFFGNPTYLAGYLLFSVFIGGWLLFDRRQVLFKKFGGWVLAASIVAQILALFFTQTRAALLGLFIGLLALGVWSAFERRPYRKAMIVLLVCLVLFGGIFVATRQAAVWKGIPGLGRLAQTSLQTSEVADRVEAWKVGLLAFEERPIVGWGSENFKYPFEKFQDPAVFEVDDSETFWDKPHNAFLEVIVTTGLLGALAVVLVVFMLVRLFWRQRRSPMTFFILAALIAYAVQIFFFFDTLATAVWLAVLFALIDSQSASEKVTVSFKSILRCIAVVLAAGSLFAIGAGFQMWRVGHIVYAARAAMHAGEIELGLKGLTAAIGLWHPHQWETHRIFASEVIDAKQKGAAIADLESIVIPKAMEQLDAITKQDPENYLNWFARAYARSVFFPRDLAQLQSAHDDLEKSFALSPQRVQSFYLSAEIYRLEGKTSQAIEQANRALALIPETRDVYFSLLALYLNVNDLSQARVVLEKAAELDFFPTTGKEFTDVTRVFSKQEDFQAGAIYFEKALNQNPESADTAMALMYFYARSGESQKAQNLHFQLITQLPEAKETQYYKEFLAPLKL